MRPATGPLPRPGLAGFTLIELVIAASLMALVLVSAYLCLNAAVASQKTIEPRLEAAQAARVALALMTADLRHACPLSPETDFLGMRRTLDGADADNLDFATHHYTPRRPHEGDFCEVSLFLDKDPVSGRLTLWRRRNPVIAPDPLSGGDREEIAQGVRGLRFEYYDGFEWFDRWGEMKGSKAETSQRLRSNLTGMPEAVRITLAMDAEGPRRPEKARGKAEEPASLVYQTVVRLDPGEAREGGSSGGSTTNAVSGAAGVSGPGAPEGGRVP